MEHHPSVVVLMRILSDRGLQSTPYLLEGASWPHRVQYPTGADWACLLCYSVISYREQFLNIVAWQSLYANTAIAKKNIFMVKMKECSNVKLKD